MVTDMNTILHKVFDASKVHSKKHDTFIGYGTAGFRTKEKLLGHVMFRMGVVAALRSKGTKSTVGVMITASHNPVGDNGVKLIDPKGEMLAATWEKHATLIANTPDDNLCQAIKDLIETEKIDLSIPSCVFLGRDTRQSGLGFKVAVESGFRCVDGEFGNFGITTTPLLHFMVVCSNNPSEFDEATPNFYYTRISTAFRRIMSMTGDVGSYVPAILFDAANGVGALAVDRIGKYIPKSVLDIRIFNDGNGTLNHECGADFVKVEKKGPVTLPVEPKSRYVSYDGDADRIIYFYYDGEKKFRMLDGDKIAVLYASHFGDLLKKAGISNLKLGLVQTAYANGGSTSYIQNELGIPVTCTLTGVKHLHHEASQNYDIGIYFEANGHGTVVFSNTAVTTLKDAARDEKNLPAVELANLMQVINPYVGDALADMLAVEAILRSKGWNVEEWDSMYKELPNRLLKVGVEDRTVIETTDAERVVVSPAGVQEQINALSLKYKNGRSFIRPSGTEDVVRVYAEADSQVNADLLAAEVAQVVYDLCKGLGSRPTLPN